MPFFGGAILNAAIFAEDAFFQLELMRTRIWFSCPLVISAGVTWQLNWVKGEVKGEDRERNRALHSAMTRYILGASLLIWIQEEKRERRERVRNHKNINKRSPTFANKKNSLTNKGLEIFISRVDFFEIVIKKWYQLILCYFFFQFKWSLLGWICSAGEIRWKLLWMPNGHQILRSWFCWNWSLELIAGMTH